MHFLPIYEFDTEESTRDIQESLDHITKALRNLQLAIKASRLGVLNRGRRFEKPCDHRRVRHLEAANAQCRESGDSVFGLGPAMPTWRARLLRLQGYCYSGV